MVLLTIGVCLPAVRGGFVLDDNPLIIENPMVKASDGLYRFWLTTQATDYNPVSWSFWWLQRRLWGENPIGYHLLNVLLHAANAVLVWQILQRLKIPAAWLIAAVFAVHPVNVATVAWVSGQRNTLSMLFYALSILLYLRFDEGGGWRWYVFSLGAGFLALLSKTAVVMLPVVLLGCVWWRHGRVRWKDIGWSLPFFALSLIMGLVNIWFEYHRAMDDQMVRSVSFLSRQAAAGWIPWFYLSKVLVPIDLTVVYPEREIDATRWSSYVPGIVLVGSLIVFWWNRKTWGRPLLFGVGYFVVTLFPVLGFFDQPFYRYSLVADHWQYYSMIGVIALAVAAGQKITHQLGEWGRIDRVLVSGAVLLLLGTAAWKRSRIYAENETLWRDNVTKNPYAWMAHNNLGSVLQGDGRLDDAIEEYQRAVRLKPDYAEAQYNLGTALWQAGDLEEAIVHYESALRSKPNLAAAHYNLAIALWQTRGVQEAFNHFEQALRIKPDYAEAHNNLGVALQQVGRGAEAIEHFEEALRIRPDYPDAHNNLGVALERADRIPEAITHFEEAVRLRPGFTEAQNELKRLEKGQ
jgi:protein O-mannosyl-transferase